MIIIVRLRCDVSSWEWCQAPIDHLFVSFCHFSFSLFLYLSLANRYKRKTSVALYLNTLIFFYIAKYGRMSGDRYVVWIGLIERGTQWQYNTVTSFARCIYIHSSIRRFSFVYDTNTRDSLTKQIYYTTGTMSIQRKSRDPYGDLRYTSNQHA